MKKEIVQPRGGAHDQWEAAGHQRFHCARGQGEGGVGPGWLRHGAPSNCKNVRIQLYKKPHSLNTKCRLLHLVSALHYALQ